MALIDALIDKVADPALRQALRDQVSTLLVKHSYGLVYQQHKPETVELPNYKVRRGCKVRPVNVDSEDLYDVLRVDGVDLICLTQSDTPETRTFKRSEVVVVREFGEPIYPGLKSVGRIDEGGDKPPHLIVNAENFHALETLLYTHEKKSTRFTLIRRTTPGIETGSTTTTTSTRLTSSVTVSGLPLWSGASHCRGAC